MKKFVLFNLFLLIAFALSAQSFEITFEGEAVENGESFTVYGEPDDAEIVLESIHVTNVSGASLDILAKKDVIYSVEGSSNTFCWAGLCYPPNTIVSPNHTTLANGETATDFSGHYYPSGTTGASEVNFVFFDMNNTSDTFYINVTFSTEGLVSSSFELSFEGEVIESGTEFWVEGAPDEAELVLENFIVKNISDNSLEAYCKKEVITAVEGSSNTFCWAGLCYPPNTIVSTEFLNMEPGDEATDFSGHYYPYETVGTSEVNFIFFDNKNPIDSAYVNVKFKTSTEGIQEEVLAENVSDAYPNPADGTVNFRVDLENSASKVELILSNILGATILSKDISRQNGEVSLSTQDLEKGLYMYSVLVNGEIVKSRKLIVIH